MPKHLEVIKLVDGSRMPAVDVAHDLYNSLLYSDLGFKVRGRVRRLLRDQIHDNLRSVELINALRKDINKW